MTELVFVDTNILLCAHDLDAGSKRQRSIDSLRRLWDDDAGRLSVQVLQEFYVNVTRKLSTPVAISTAREVVATYRTWVRDATSADTVLRATHIAEMAQISFWDALIVASAEQDLNAGQTIAGVLIVNPLLSAA
jgi:predicted nucleic acid-binding protein